MAYCWLTMRSGMLLSGAPFIVPQHERDVDLAIATVVPLIFLTTLLPAIPDDPDISNDKSGKQFQYTMRGLTILAGFAALITAFLQLAGEETTAGTISGMVLLLVTSIFAICAMAWPIVAGAGKVGVTVVTFVFGLIAAAVVGVVAVVLFIFFVD